MQSTNYKYGSLLGIEVNPPEPEQPIPALTLKD